MLVSEMLGDSWNVNIAQDAGRTAPKVYQYQLLMAAEREKEELIVKHKHAKQKQRQITRDH